MSSVAHPQGGAAPHPVPADDEARVAALHALELLDTPQEERFDRITRLAREVFDAPIALISLVDSNRQWFKSCDGLNPGETPRGASFCTYAIMGDEILEVVDARVDPVFANNPSVLDSPHVVFYAGQPVHDPSGHRVGTLCVIDHKPRHLTADQRRQLRDLAGWVEVEFQAVEVTRAARTAERLRHHLTSVLNATAEGIVAIDSAGVVTLANPAAEGITGWADGDGLRGRHFHNTVHGQFPDGTPYPAEQCPVSKAIGDGRTLAAVDDVFWRRDGIPVLVSTSAAPLTEDAKKIGGVVVFEDVTAQREVERLKDEFVSVISHELRTPLTSIRGSLGLVATGKFGELPSEARMLVDRALRNTERLVRLVTDVLDYERLSSGRLMLNRKEVRVDLLVAQSVETVRDAADASNVRLEVGAIPELEVVVDGDRIVQALVNLLSNAVKFSTEGSVVTVTADVDGDSVRLHISDTGRGIPAEALDRIFARFAQADASDAREKSGTGLGLAITKSIVEAHEGTITVTSSPGVGSTFTLELPRTLGVAT
ncbi:GAF domain-containing protein [Mycobacterium sp. Y57]|uniref:GAF domain-containing sensor histidine kinase n=1 Tax=Mycolicibacterium xanthum TaxID=2796469 RepID=UPI001C844853|nr:GAF domain-containing sensor histidine kinase [Mycolicibacterium xanthum]MBX7435477.1 GAF domain-containing protein [Mycolicibacterium xanthum]